MTTDPFERAARREIEAAQRDERDALRTGFRIHVAVYAAVMVMLAVVWATTSPDSPWIVYPALGWGIGVVAHLFATRQAMARLDRSLSEDLPSTAV